MYFIHRLTRIKDLETCKPSFHKVSIEINKKKIRRNKFISRWLIYLKLNICSLLISPELFSKLLIMIIVSSPFPFRFFNNFINTFVNHISFCFSTFRFFCFPLL